MYQHQAIHNIIGKSLNNNKTFVHVYPLCCTLSLFIRSNWLTDLGKLLGNGFNKTLLNINLLIYWNGMTFRWWTTKASQNTATRSVSIHTTAKRFHPERYCSLHFISGSYTFQKFHAIERNLAFVTQFFSAINSILIPDVHNAQF